MNTNRMEKYNVRIIALLMSVLMILQDVISFAAVLQGKGQQKFYDTHQLTYHKKEFAPDSNEQALATSPRLAGKTKALRKMASNPSQAESSSFSIGSTDGMVDKFTGDFSYSIPLMDVEGYPIVLSYNSNVGMMSEASWVGLGWDLNVGSVSREMRGIPDEFNGDDHIIRTYSQKPFVTDEGRKFGTYVAYQKKKAFKVAGLEVDPSLQVTALFGNYKNTYLGKGRTFDLSLSGAFNLTNGGEGIAFAPGFSLGYSRDSKNGVGTNASIGLKAGVQKNDGENNLMGGVTFGKSFNSRQGVVAKSVSLGVEGGYGFGKEKTRATTGGNVSSSTYLTYGSTTAIPRVTFETRSNGYYANIDAFFGYDKGGRILKFGLMYGSYHSNDDIIYNNPTAKQIDQPAYGFLHSGKRENRPYNAGGYPVMDFERINDFGYSEEMKNLPFSAQTYDYFHVNAAGAGGMYRAYRNEYGAYYDPNTESMINASSEIISDPDIQQVGAGVTLKPTPIPTPAPPAPLPPIYTKFELSYSTGLQDGDNKSGRWLDANVMAFEKEGAASSFDTRTYFKQVGELTPNDPQETMWNDLGGSGPDFFDVNHENSEMKQTSYLMNSKKTYTKSTYAKPQRANQFIPKTADQLLNDRSIYNDQITTAEGLLFPRNGGIRQANHISAVEVVTDNGTHYTYGIPVYSIANSEVSFSATGLAQSNGMVNYNGASGVNSITNDLGRDGYFDKTTMPAYPTAFLLTEMVGSDYIDRTDNGPTADDIGNYYKFDYNPAYLAGTNPYQWRFPMSGASSTPNAFQNEGFLGTDQDDMANYSYGTKEVWYLSKIKSRNYVAVMELEDRFDGHGVQNENGNLSTSQPIKALKRIKLYTQQQFEEQVRCNCLVPLQTVEFEYDYSLCKKDPSNRFTGVTTSKSGKLTLKSVRIFTAESMENALRSYDFTYSSTNPDFDYAAIDAWGNYKPNDVNLPNAQYPYATQHVGMANSYADAWKLVKIENPMGGVMEVTYEADHYGYVQDKRAMKQLNVYKMTNLLDFFNLNNASSWDGSYLATNNFVKNEEAPEIIKSYNASSYFRDFGKVKSGIVPNNVIIFELDKPLSGISKSDAIERVKTDYFMHNSEQLLDVYFKTRVQIKTGVEDIVPVFATISREINDIFNNELAFSDDLKPIGVMPPDAGGVYHYGYVVVNPVNSGKKEKIIFNKKDGKDKDKRGMIMHPIQRAALDFARMNLVDKVYGVGACEECDKDMTVDRGAIWGNDIYRTMILKANYAPNFIAGKTFVTLYDEDKIKYGGNARVKQIVYKDNWTAIAAEYQSTYQWNYQYINPEDDNMGVAAFEPRQILDENPFYRWETYIDKTEKFPDETNFTPTPLALNLYPNPLVGYEEVVVTFQGSEDKGHSRAKFHTYKESAYRIIEEVGAIEPNHKPKKNLITGSTVDLFGFTQGYYIRTNDFHGKPDEMEVLDAQGNSISRSKYEYYGLGEKLPFIDGNGQVLNRTANVDYDAHLDTRYIHQMNEQLLAGLAISLKFKPAPPSLPFIPGLSPIYSRNENEKAFYSLALIKHENASAIVKRIITETIGSVNSAENLVFDQKTGQVLVSSLNDEFNDKLYSINYPAHWFYDELRELTDMEGRAFSITVAPDASFTQTTISASDPRPFTQGDLLSINGTVYRVIKADPVPENNVLYLYAIDGSSAAPAPQGTWNATLVHCHRDNRLTESMQSVVTKKNPFISGVFTFPEQEIISSSAVTYRNRNNIRCGNNCDGLENPNQNNNEVSLLSNYDPYSFGSRGDLFGDGSFAWQTERKNNEHPHGIRFDGTYTDYVPFYKLGSGSKWYPINYAGHPNHSSSSSLQKWRKLGEVTVFNEFGLAQESRDQLGVPSAVIYGYNATLKTIPVAQAVNAKLQDIAFDGFEDYTYLLSADCPVSLSHFDFKEGLKVRDDAFISAEKRHSGLSSLLLEDGSNVRETRSISNICVPANIGAANPLIGNSGCNCYETFKPQSGTYVVGAWIHNDQETETAGIEVIFLQNGAIIGQANFAPQGERLDGWQRLEGQFTIPANCTDIQFSLVNGTLGNVYFDDFRVHPLLAGMTTVVYNPTTLLPLATHDGYNYTTFYNYDENLQLSRVKVETKEGIRTIVETESGGKTHYVNLEGE